MRLIQSILPPTLALAAVLVLGYAAHTLQHGLHPVEAQSRGGSHSDSHSDEPLVFQLSSSLGPASSLTVSNSAEHTLYVYQAVT